MDNTGKINFVIDINKKLEFCSELRIEVVKVEVRPMTTFGNDTVYNTRFMAPTYIEDAQVVGEKTLDFAGKGGLGLWQMVEVHLSQISELIEELKAEYPQISFPEIDPTTKEINVLTQSKKNTKMFEARSYLFEEFFNFLFRHPAITPHALFIARKFKIISPFWEYICGKNDYIAGRRETKDLKSYFFGPDHCQLCRQVTKMSVSDVMKLREGLERGKRKDNCFNAFNLLRYHICKQPASSFHSLEELLLREYYESGRIDYNMLTRETLHRVYQEVKVYACCQARKVTVESDYRRKVG